MQLKPGPHGWVKAPHSSTSATGGEDRDKGKKRKAPKHKDEAPEQPLFSHTVLSIVQRNHTSHSCIPLDNFVVCVSLTFAWFSHFSEHFFYTTFIVASAALTCPSSYPWGLIPWLQFVLEEDRGLAFIHPFAAPNSNGSDLLSVWHLTLSVTAALLIHLHSIRLCGSADYDSPVRKILSVHLPWFTCLLWKKDKGSLKPQTILTSC